MPAPVCVLGAYELWLPIGRGGVGEVWRARHRSSGTPVAIKVLQPAAARRAALVEGFHREVAAMAGLRHPNIAPVLDAGAVTPEEARRSRGRLVPGPFLVMELATCSLAGAPPPRSWVEASAILEALLAGLARAHAQGVTHRDLNPGNVLIGAPDGAARAPPAPQAPGELPLRAREAEQGGRVLLSDFGLALAGTPDPELVFASGTPAYMAPEQFSGQAAEVGPWTDLYALGCLGWWLVAGRPPFQPRTWEQAMLLHTHRPLPRLTPLYPVPEALEGWLRRLVARDPMSRFRLAADARHALGDLGDPVEHLQPLGLDPPERTQPIGQERPDEAPVVAVVPRASLAPRAPPPTPLTWRGPAERTGPPTLPGVGRALLHLRAPPLCGRSGEQDQLWAALVGVARGRRAAAVVLRGAPGLGSRRLGGWLASTAQELGAAMAWRVSAGADLGGMARQVLGAEGLEGEALAIRVSAWLALRGCLKAAVVADTLALVRGEHADPHTAIRALISLEGRSRPVILLIGATEAEPELGRPLRGLITDLLSRPERTPALVVVPGAAVPPTEELPLARTLTLSPLGAQSLQRALRGVILLDPELEADIVARAAGNPGYALQLLLAWEELGALEEAGAGVRLGAQAPPLPPAVEARWAPAVARTLVGLGPPELAALEVAAALGLEVDVAHWQRAVAAAGLVLDDALPARGVALGLFAPTGVGRRALTWTHPAPRELLLRQAGAEGRLEAARRACAEALGGPYRALRHHLHHGSLSEGLALLQARAAGQAERPPQSQSWGETVLLQAQLLLLSGRLEDAAHEAARVEAGARRHGLASLVPEAQLLCGRVALRRGHLDVAHACFAEARLGLRAAGRSEDGALLGAAQVAMFRREPEVAEDLLRLVTSGPPAGAPASDVEAAHKVEYLLAYGQLALFQGALEVGRGRLRRALRMAETLALRAGVVQALTGLADVARWEGLEARAEDRYRRAINLAEAAGSAEGLAVRVRLVLLQVMRGEGASARRGLEGLSTALLRRGMEMDATLAALALGVIAAEEGDWDTYMRTLAQALSALSAHPWSSPDLDWLLLRATTLARTRGPPGAADGPAAFLRADDAARLADRGGAVLGGSDVCPDGDAGVDRR